MQIAILLFDRVRALDAVGPYEVLSRMPGAQPVFVGENLGPVRTDTGRLGLVVDAVLWEVPRPDFIVVPGGPGHTAHLTNGAVHRWLRAADTTTAWTTSVSTGSLILASAGLLAGRKAATHWLALEALGRYGVDPSPDRVVVDGKYATAAGVSAGIDMALDLTGRIAGTSAAQVIQLGIHYSPDPPGNSGSPSTAPERIRRHVQHHAREILGAPALRYQYNKA